MRAAGATAYERCFASPGCIALCGVEQFEAALFGRVLHPETLGDVAGGQ